MTCPKASPLVLVGVLAAAGVGTLLWCAWLVLTAPLPTGAATAAWVMWVLCVAAVVTLVAYLRELVRHRVSWRGSWRPLPGLVLLWVAGLTALVAFPVVMPERAPGPTRSDRPDGNSRPTPEAPDTTGPTLSRPVTSPSASRSTRVSTSTRARPTSAHTSADRQPGAATATAGTSGPAPATVTRAPRPMPTTPSSTTPSSTASPTSTPIIDITLPRGKGRPADRPPPRN